MSDDQPDPREQVYLDERKLLNDMEREAANNFDRSMITLSAGALVVSLTFIKDVVENPVHSEALFAAWVFFGVATVSTLLSMFSARAAAEKQRGILDSDYEAHRDNMQGYTSPKNKWLPAVGRTNSISMITFALGAIALMCFAMLNIG